MNRPNPKNRVDPEIESRVVKIALDNPALGQQRVSNELRKEGLFISPGGVQPVWQRHDLETFQKPLKALEAKVAQEWIILTESQLQPQEKAKEEKEAAGEIETEHPGYLIAQDTFYVGNRKGVGRIYQKTVIDTYSKVAFAKLYDRKNVEHFEAFWNFSLHLKTVNFSSLKRITNLSSRKILREITRTRTASKLSVLFAKKAYKLATCSNFTSVMADTGLIIAPRNGRTIKNLSLNKR